MHMHSRILREGDTYAALRDAETALTLCATHKPALQHRVACLQRLGWFEEARRFLRAYQEAFPWDKEFYSKLQPEVEKMAAETGQSSLTGAFTIWTWWLFDCRPC